MSNYIFNKYVFFDRWISYWHQINEVLNFSPASVLIIGKGDGIVSDILKKYIKNSKTLDIDKELKPDIVASVEKIPLTDCSFDVILCAEVLEHLPFNKFEIALREIGRVAEKFVVLSLPHFGPPVKISFKIPFSKEIKLAFKTPFPLEHEVNEHYWEIGKKGYPCSRIGHLIKKHFNIKKEFIPFENQYHHFYILHKK